MRVAMTVEAKNDYIEKVRDFLEQNDESGLERFLSGLHASELGRVLSGVSIEEAKYLFRLLDPERASEALLEVDERLRKTLISAISSKELIEVVHEMETDDAADIISGLPDEDARQVLEGIEESAAVQKLLVYPEDTAGGKMQAELVSVHEDATVQDTIEAVRAKSEDIEHISNVFVVDGEKRLVGTVSLDKLILARPYAKIKDIADREPMKVATGLDQEEVAKIFQRYDLLSIPVVDNGNRLVGRITVDDIVDVLEEEIFEDFYKMAGLNVEEGALDPAMRSIWMRAPWLFVNLGTAFLAASVVKVFQGTIEQFVVLAVLMPIVAGMGGNAATQAITVVVRGLALGELSLKNARRILLKETSVGLANGFMMGAVAAVIAYAFGVQPIIGFLLFLAMICNMMIAGLAGSLIPLLLKLFKVDPAISSSIFVT
ncbi:MAG: magnesium transporter, partial [Deltaproteobacteria bacterium]|nr:magnesium transporter [Deltaproteobacteria bacterium]